MATSDLGIGIAGVFSIGPRFTLAVGFDCLAQSLARRLITPRGALPWSPNDGTDLREYLNRGDTPQNRFSAARAAKDECEKDERVQSASVDAQFNSGSSQLTLTIGIQTADGPFQLVLSVDNLTVSILSVNT